MAGTSVERIYCEELEAEVQVFLNEDGTYTGYCFSKSTFVPDPYKDKPEGYAPQVQLKTREQIQEEIAEVSEYQTVDLRDRLLKKENLEHFGIKIGMSEQDGITPKLHYYPYQKGNELTSYKVRLIEGKRMWTLGDHRSVDLFGWKQALEGDGRTLFITEGELDAVAVYQMLRDANKGTAYAEWKPSVVSLAHGASAVSRDLTPHLEEINRRWPDIIIIFDNDEAGEKAVEEAIRILPHAKVAKLPSKDANDCIMEGKIKQAVNAIRFQAHKPKNTRLVVASSLAEDARTPAPWGYSYPYKALTDLTRGRRKGEVTYIGAGVGLQPIHAGMHV